MIVTLADVFRAVDAAGPWHGGSWVAASRCMSWVERSYQTRGRVLAKAEAGTSRADVAKRLVTEWMLARCPG